MALERLDSAMVLTTVETLHGRIAARFPDRGLVKVAEELAGLIWQNIQVVGELREEQSSTSA